MNFNGYHSQCVLSTKGVKQVHNMQFKSFSSRCLRFTVLLLFIVVFSMYRYVPKAFEKPEVLVSIDFPNVPIKQFCPPLDLSLPQDLIAIQNS